MSADVDTLEARKAALEEKIKQLEGVSVAAPQTSGAVKSPLDELDCAKLENIMLKEQIVDRQKVDARQSFYLYLVQKHSVDVDKFEMSVDAQSKELVLTPK